MTAGVTGSQKGKRRHTVDGKRKGIERNRKNICGVCCELWALRSARKKCGAERRSDRRGVLGFERASWLAFITRRKCLRHAAYEEKRFIQLTVLEVGHPKSEAFTPFLGMPPTTYGPPLGSPLKGPSSALCHIRVQLLVPGLLGDRPHPNPHRR